MIDPSAFDPENTLAFLHQDHWDDLVESLRVRRTNVTKTQVIAYNKELRGKGINGWEKKKDNKKD